ncbi:hypothetical protein LTS18_001866, partial [Coniosporium uncinatum]
VAKDSQRVLELALDLDQAGLLRHATISLTTHIITAVIMSVKVLGLHFECLNGIIELLNSVVLAFGRANDDEHHPMRPYATCISALIRKAEGLARPQSRRNSTTNTISTANESNAFATDMADIPTVEDWAQWLQFQSDASLLAMDGSFTMDEFLDYDLTQ